MRHQVTVDAVISCRRVVARAIDLHLGGGRVGVGHASHHTARPGCFRIEATTMPSFGLTELSPLDSVAHVIQVALTPIFLLSGIAALLNVFSARLARVADRVDLVTTH